MKIWRRQLRKILVWDPDTYGGQTLIHPQAKNIWRPRVILTNTLEDRDIFAEDNAPVTVTFNGSMLWFPGSTFPSSCALNMVNYPFDKQTCSIWLLPMGYTVKEVQFVPIINRVGVNYFVKNGEWELINSSIFILNTSDSNGSDLSTIMITFQLKRNPAGILINILLPVVFISFLNLTAFLIPVESGEKISYGTTVLMALAVFMTTMSSMLPVSSDKLPSVVLYIFILLIISLLTVITTIIIVFLHHKEEKEEHHLRAQANLNRMMNKVTMVRRAVHVFDTISTKHTNKVRPVSPATEDSEGSSTTIDDHQKRCKLLPQQNRYKVIGKYIDFVSLIVFFTAWLSTTLGFLFNVSM